MSRISRTTMFELLIGEDPNLTIHIIRNRVDALKKAGKIEEDDYGTKEKKDFNKEGNMYFYKKSVLDKVRNFNK